MTTKVVEHLDTIHAAQSSELMLTTDTGGNSEDARHPVAHFAFEETSTEASILLRNQCAIVRKESLANNKFMSRKVPLFSNVHILNRPAPMLQPCWARTASATQTE